MTDKKNKRPISIWITQIMVIGFFIYFIYGLLTCVAVIPERIEAGVTLFGFVRVFLLHLVFLFFFFITFWGLLKRKAFGRWLGVLVVGFLALISLAFVLQDVVGYKSIGESLVVFLFFTFGGLIPSLLLLILTYNLVFSSKVKTFFKKVAD